MTTRALHGWIQPCSPTVTETEARTELESLGVKVGEWDMRLREFQKCKVSEETLVKLKKLGNRYVWGLE